MFIIKSMFTLWKLQKYVDYIKLGNFDVKSEIPKLTFSFSVAPTSSTNLDEEDIDIVGDDGNNNKNNNSGNLSSSESSRDLQLHVYGPPQFTEADVLACMNTPEENDNEEEKMEDKQSEADQESLIKREVNSPDPGMDDQEAKEDDREPQDIKKVIQQDRSKCSKCLVRKYIVTPEERDIYLINRKFFL